jgi:hypothetical protein
MAEPNETGKGETSEIPTAPSVPQRPAVPDIVRIQAGEPTGDRGTMDIPNEIRGLLKRLPPGILPPGIQ